MNEHNDYDWKCGLLHKEGNFDDLDSYLRSLDTDKLKGRPRNELNSKTLSRYKTNSKIESEKCNSR